MLSAKVICLFAALGLTVFSTTHAVTRDLENELTEVSQDVSTYQYHKDFKTCPGTLDIAYIIDGSGSISDSNFELQKTVVKVMAYFFGVMKLGTHNGVVVYSDSAQTAIKFSDFHTFEGFRDAVKALQKRGGATRIDAGLEEAHDNLFAGDGGARSSKKVQKIAVVFSEGPSGGQSLDIVVQQLKDQDVMVFGVGVGDAAPIAELKTMVMRDDQVFHANDFLDLYIKAGFIARIICQHAQFRGSPGPSGPQGPDGPTGLRGAEGVQGSGGIRGSTGAHGPQGQRGLTGASGEDGVAGAPGANGAPGPQGNKGPKGARGDEGATGARGKQGDDGHNGDAGARGGQGDQGPNGETGEPGDFAQPGADGTNGQPGAAGELGAVGDRGDPGRAGADGANGARGPKGQPGATGPLGTVGAPGAPGPKGDRGARGSDGIRGEDGELGASGVSGAPGIDGATGDAGARGPRGPSGPGGVRGNRGQAGSDGSDGADGPRGPKGSAGIPGTDSAQTIVCEYKQSVLGEDAMSCNDPSSTATDCGCARGCGEWSISQDGQTCSCLCNTYVPQSFHEVGVNCCKLQ